MTKEQLEAVVNEIAGIMHIDGTIEVKCNRMLAVFRQVGKMLPGLKDTLETMMKKE